mmetsp:Transcript_7854/g.21588  ORF Transcript_7854/g.21588 Transcript_7854/m.21588 type:complete len:289 (+) Transcript_7854:605-1471(+)
MIKEWAGPHLHVPVHGDRVESSCLRGNVIVNVTNTRITVSRNRSRQHWWTTKWWAHRRSHWILRLWRDDHIFFLIRALLQECKNLVKVLIWLRAPGHSWFWKVPHNQEDRVTLCGELGHPCSEVEWTDERRASFCGVQIPPTVCNTSYRKPVVMVLTQIRQGGVCRILHGILRFGMLCWKKFQLITLQRHRQHLNAEISTIRRRIYVIRLGCVAAQQQFFVTIQLHADLCQVSRSEARALQQVVQTMHATEAAQLTLVVYMRHGCSSVKSMYCKNTQRIQRKHESIQP